MLLILLLLRALKVKLRLTSMLCSLRCLPLLAACALLFGGCGGPKPRHGRAGEGELTPRVPPFLSGPMAVLLTKANGFSAHVVVQTALDGESSETISGELLGRGSHLLFAPNYEDKSQKRLRAAGLSFLWDTATGGGFVLSEALQAYAPVSYGSHPTNFVTIPGRLPPQRIDGYSCSSEQATVLSSDGSVAVFDVWRAMDASGLPVRISASPGSLPPVLSLSQLRLPAPAPELFQVPEGFTKYASAEAMLSELTVRQANLKRKEQEPIESAMPTMPGRPPGSH